MNIIKNKKTLDIYGHFGYICTVTDLDTDR